MKQSVLITLIVFILILITTNIYLLSLQRTKSGEKHSGEHSICYVGNKLGLSNEQTKTYEAIKHKYREKTSIIVDSLHSNQNMMMDFLSENTNDSEHLSYYQDRIADFQKALLSQSLSQFLELKEILEEDQLEAANQIFRGLFVCRPSCEHTQSLQD